MKVARCTGGKIHRWAVYAVDNHWDYIKCLRCQVTKTRRGGRR